MSVVAGLNIFDLAVIATVGISTVVGLIRGLTKEVLSIGGWVGAALAAYLGYPYLKPFARAHIESTLVADILAGVGIFIVVLFILSVLSTMIASAVKKSMLGPVDRSLGAIFGLARGVLIVCAAYLVLTLIASHGERPAYLSAGQTRPLVEEGAVLLHSLVPSQHGLDAERRIRGLTSKPAEEAATATPPDRPTDTGYKAEEAQGMNELIRDAAKGK